MVLIIIVLICSSPSSSGWWRRWWMPSRCCLVINGLQGAAGGKKGLQGTRGHIGDHLGGYKQTYSNPFCNLYLHKTYLWDCARIFVRTTNVSVLSEPIRPNIRTNTNNGDPNQGAPATIWLHLILLPKDNHWQNTKREAVILLQYHGSSEIASAL